jgi:tetratricopeptide (TPR) repeat protein
MSDRYRVDRTFGGGYSVRKTDFVEDAAMGAAGVAGGLIGMAIGGMANAARTSRDRRLQEASAAMQAAAEASDFDRLLALATDFVRRYPQQAHGYAWLAHALAEKGRYDEAIAAVNKAASLGLESIFASFLLATAYSKKGDVAKAIDQFTALTQSSDSEARHAGYVGRSRMLLEIGDLDQALQDANTAVGLAPGPRGYTLRGDIYKARSELAKAIDDYTRADRLQPSSPEVLEKRAAAYDLIGWNEEARADRAALEHAVAATRDLTEARKLLAYLRQNGLTLTIARNGQDLEHKGRRLKPETEAAMKRLTPQLLQLLAEA